MSESEDKDYLQEGSTGGSGSDGSEDEESSKEGLSMEGGGKAVSCGQPIPHKAK